MQRLEKIDYAIIETLKAHPEGTPEGIIRGMLFSGRMQNHITSSNNARRMIEDLTPDDVIKEIAIQALRVSKIDLRAGNLSGKANCVKFYDSLKDLKIKKNEVVSFLKSDPDFLKALAYSFTQNRYYPNNGVNLKKLDSYVSPSIIDCIRYLSREENKEIKPKNLRIFHDNINKCESDVIHGVQLQKKNVEYMVGTSMFASSSIGNVKPTQEDSVLLSEYPKNKDYKMLLVADGVGGSQNGGAASSYVAEEMLEWFKGLKKEDFENTDMLRAKLSQKIQEMNREVVRTKNGSQTTFLCGIVGKNETLVSSVGDSRGYIVKNNELIQVTKDDSQVQKYYDAGYIRRKDDMRFHIYSNIITSCIGSLNPERPLRPHMYRIKNTDYDSLVLLSDGVTDCLSDSRIMAITANTPKEKIASALVNAANTTRSYRPEQKGEFEYNTHIEAGKDNSTAAIFSKKR